MRQILTLTLTLIITRCPTPNPKPNPRTLLKIGHSREDLAKQFNPEREACFLRRLNVWDIEP